LNVNPFDKLEDPRRRLLVQALTVGLVAAGVPAGNALAQRALGTRPTKLPPGQSIYRIRGTATVNNAPATLETVVRPGDTVETGKNSEIIFVVDGHSMIVRSESRLEIESGKKEASSAIIAGLRLLTGKLLLVSRRSQLRVTTSTATIGIRGTGWYAESDPERTYFCTCYGASDVAAINDPASKELVVATHHDRPLYILARAPAGKSIRSAPFINHTDQELSLIEALVGRTPPFVFPKDDYSGPRRDY
jgi:hypothetical protein